MKLRFHTTRADRFWSSLYSASLIGGGFFVTFVSWGFLTLKAIEYVWASELVLTLKILAIPLAIVGCGIVIAGVVSLGSGIDALFPGNACPEQEYTLEVVDGGIEVTSSGSQTVHPFSAIHRMRRWLSLWVIEGEIGALSLFRYSQVREGCPEAFARNLHERRC